MRKAILIPISAWLLFFIQHNFQIPILDFLLLFALLYCTKESVHHAEILAHKIGEPFGTVVLALAVTSIEVSLIISMMMAGGETTSALARDTVFAAVMIILNGMIGLSLFAGGIKHSTQSFVSEGVNSTLTALVAISVLTLILPNYTLSVEGPFYSDNQLIFVSFTSLIIYCTFIFVQNIKHKNLFVGSDEVNEVKGEKPTAKQAYFALLLLLVNLGAVVYLAESLAPNLERILTHYQAPHTFIGVVIACIVLMPEGLSAYNAAKRNQLQKSLNLSLGSALASISLTIPIVSFYSIYHGIQLSLGIDAVSTILFLLSLFITILSLSTGKTTILQGVILLIVFLVYLFTIMFP